MALDNNRGGRKPKRFRNTVSDVIVITEDKLYRKLTPFVEILKKDTGWISSLGIVVSISLTLSTTSIQDRWGIPSKVWYVIWSVFLVMSVLYTLYCAYNCWKSYKINVQSFIEEMKKE